MVRLKILSPSALSGVKEQRRTMIPTLENLKHLSDEELVNELERRTVRDGERVWRNANIANEIGRREALKRKPGDPGTKENPIMKNGKAFIYTMYNHLALWEK